MNILKVDYRSSEAPELFARSLHQTGFGVLTNHPIPAELIQKVYDDWKAFFASEKKFEFLFNKDTQEGYFPFKSEHAKDSKQKDLKEFYHVYKGRPFTENISENTRQLFSSLDEIGAILLDWLDSQTPVDIRSRFSQRLSTMAENSAQTLFRVIHYPPLTGEEVEGEIRAAAHEDINLITLLPASTAMGLQVRDLEGHWYDVEGNFGDIVVNVGDMLQMASEGFYRSTTHRVVNPSGLASRMPRYSMPVFIHPRPNVRLSDSHTADEYLTERLREIGLR